jgi:hypothetical protein
MEKNKDGIPQNGWNEYSKLVLAELERLNENDEKIQETLNEISLKLGRVDSIEKDIEGIIKWKRYMDDVASPNTLKEMKKDVASLNTFKTVATTVWAVVQIAFGVFIAFFKQSS